jgi:hypothetical protein
VGETLALLASNTGENLGNETLALLASSTRSVYYYYYYYFIIIIIIINYFKLRVGFHPVAVALQNDTDKTYYIQNTDNITRQMHKTTKCNTVFVKCKETISILLWKRADALRCLLNDCPVDGNQ